MSLASERVKKWRKNTKDRVVSAMGGKCSCCGYNKCSDALALHHLNPANKKFSFREVRANSKKWSDIVEELQKCVLVCLTCHAEIHAGIRHVENKQYFNKDYIKYKKTKKRKCSVCGKNTKTLQNKTCSKKCLSKIKSKVNWEKIDLIELKKNFSNIQIAKRLKITEAAVRKKYKKIILFN